MSLSSGLAIYSNDPYLVWKLALLLVFILGSILGYFVSSLEYPVKCPRVPLTENAGNGQSDIGVDCRLFVAIVNTLDPLFEIFSNASIPTQSLHCLLVEVFFTFISLLWKVFCSLQPWAWSPCVECNISAPWTVCGLRET